MAHVQTKDPLGLCGALVVCIVKSVSKNGVGGGGFDLFGDAARTPMHTWVTRYDAGLDCYSLFAPARGVSVHSRGDMMKLVSDPHFDVQRVDDPGSASADMPLPPILDTTSRFVGVPFMRTTTATAAEAEMKGVVACFLPFADAYRVEFDDGSTADVSEDAVVDSMVQLLTTIPATGRSKDDSTRKRKRTPLSLLPPAPVRSASAPVSVAVPPPSMMPVSFAGLPGVDSSPVVTHSNILELAAARDRSVSSTSSTTTNSTSSSGPVEGAAAAGPLGQYPTGPLVKKEPVAPTTTTSSDSATNIILLIDNEPDVAMIPLDVDEEVRVPVVSATSGNDPWATTTVQSMYVVTQPEHARVAPLESRNHAYKYVRDELLNLLDRPEAGAKKIAVQYDILRNPDIKHISSIKRFTEASGLVVLNHLLSTFLSEPETGSRDADVLLMLKIVAMLPIPLRKHVADSKIALTIGKLAKPRSFELYPKLPVCTTHLAKWIKRKWTEHFRKQENQEKDASRLRGGAPAPSSVSKAGHPSQRLATRTPQPSLAGEQPDRLVDTTPIPRLASRPVLSNLATDAARTRPTTDVMGNPIASRASVSLPLSAGGATSGRRSSLKPDWLRQQETLRRTRFTSEAGQDSAAEYNHYKRVRQNGPVASGAPAAVSGSSTVTGQGATSAVSSVAVDNEQLEAAGGVRGTYGRKQSLSFASRWNVVEFLRDAPPNSIRPAASSSSTRSSYLHHAQSQHQLSRQRSILRRESKYQGNLDSFR